MSDSKTGTVKVQDELEHVITPESKEIFIKNDGDLLKEVGTSLKGLLLAKSGKF